MLAVTKWCAFFRCIVECMAWVPYPVHRGRACHVTFNYGLDDIYIVVGVFDKPAHEPLPEALFGDVRVSFK
jgi:hypothetical protein